MTERNRARATGHSHIQIISYYVFQGRAATTTVTQDARHASSAGPKTIISTEMQVRTQSLHPIAARHDCLCYMRPIVLLTQSCQRAYPAPRENSRNLLSVHGAKPASGSCSALEANGPPNSMCARCMVCTRVRSSKPAGAGARPRPFSRK